MKVKQAWMRTAGAAVALMMVIATGVSAQVGKSQGVMDVNLASEKDLVSFPHMTPAIAKALMAKRPFSSPTELNAFLLEQKLTAEQAMAFYEKAFVHINLNTATPAEILLVPGAGRRMVREFAEYRPWKTWAQFVREIGKYVGAQGAAKLAQYAFIPMNVNTASDADMLTIQGADQAWVDRVKKGRPYNSIASIPELEKNAGKTQARFFVLQ